MPSILKKSALSYAKAEAELQHFKSWLADHKRFTEREVIQELKTLDNLCLLLSFLGTSGQPDLFKHEFEIQGVFRADYIVGSSSSRHFTLVEFEGGQENSLFGPKQTNQMRDWGSQVQHALGQIVDWSWAINDNQKSIVLINAIGYAEFSRTYVVICGLESAMDETEKSRLNWLSDHCKITDTRVLFMTYDDVILHFEGQLDIYREALAQANTAPPKTV
ncbi:Shedu anti-phage system protein SduA domain-containing protein [Pararhizobium sp. O133]|uniref:Shedu anti-phage system protein SduA domain-containing protein n=1 Tax=Pararhizobium sp. O133 TaxID=3449278 RepID=UPI003F6834A7